MKFTKLLPVIVATFFISFQALAYDSAADLADRVTQDVFRRILPNLGNMGAAQISSDNPDKVRQGNYSITGEALRETLHAFGFHLQRSIYDRTCHRNYANSEPNISQACRSDAGQFYYTNFQSWLVRMNNSRQAITYQTMKDYIQGLVSGRATYIVTP